MKIQEYILFMIFIWASIAISLWALILSNSWLIDHQQILQAISWTQISIEMKIREQWLFDCEKYTWWEMCTRSQCEELRK